MELSLGNGPVQQKPNLVEVDRQVPMDIQGWVKPIQPNASNLVSSLQWCPISVLFTLSRFIQTANLKLYLGFWHGLALRVQFYVSLTMLFFSLTSLL